MRIGAILSENNRPKKCNHIVVKIFNLVIKVVYAKLGSAYARLGLALDPHDIAGALGDKKIYLLISTS